MNCCDTFGNCNQGRDCPVRSQAADAAVTAGAALSAPAAAKVATARPTYTLCDVSGQCQASRPCNGHCQLWSAWLQQEAELDADFRRTDRQLGLLLTLTGVLIGLSLLAGMVAANLDALQLGLQWLSLKLELLAYRWASAWS